MGTNASLRKKYCSEFTYYKDEEGVNNFSHPNNDGGHISRHYPPQFVINEFDEWMKENEDWDNTLHKIRITVEITNEEYSSDN